MVCEKKPTDLHPFCHQDSLRQLVIKEKIDFLLSFWLTVLWTKKEEEEQVTETFKGYFCWHHIRLGESLVNTHIALRRSLWTAGEIKSIYCVDVSRFDYLTPEKREVETSVYFDRNNYHLQWWFCFVVHLWSDKKLSSISSIKHSRFTFSSDHWRILLL